MLVAPVIFLFEIEFETVDRMGQNEKEQQADEFMKQMKRAMRFSSFQITVRIYNAAFCL